VGPDVGVGVALADGDAVVGPGVPGACVVGAAHAARPPRPATRRTVPIHRDAWGMGTLSLVRASGAGYGFATTAADGMLDR